MMREIVLTCEASDTVGMGHAVRMYALAEALEAEGASPILLTHSWPYIVERLRGFPARVVDHHRFIPADIVLVDDLPLERWHEREPNGALYVVLDDHGDRDHTGATLVIRQHFNALVEKPPQVPSLLGPRYAMLRKALPIRYGATGSVVLRAGSRVANLWRDGEPWEVVRAEVPASMIALECAAAGVPLSVYAPSLRHENIVGGFVQAGAARWPDTPKRCREPVDGKGAARVAAVLLQLARS